MYEIDETVDTKHQSSALAARLGYAGLIPFAAGAALVWVQPQQLSLAFIGDFLRWVLVYGAVILSFLGGAQWGAGIHARQFDRLIPAVCWALIGWVAVVPPGIIPGFEPPLHIRYIIMFAAFSGLLVTELLSGQWAKWYTGIRIKVSLGVLALLLITALGITY